MVTGGETGWPNPKGNGATDGIVQPVWWLVEEYLIIYCKYTVISWNLLPWTSYGIWYCSQCEGDDDKFELTIFRDRKNSVDNLWQADSSLCHKFHLYMIVLPIHHKFVWLFSCRPSPGSSWSSELFMLMLIVLRSVTGLCTVEQSCEIVILMVYDRLINSMSICKVFVCLSSFTNCINSSY